MSNRSINVLASMMVVFLAGFCSQAFPVNDHVQSSIASREPSGPGDEDQVAVADGDSDDASDDLALLHCTSNWSPLGATFPIYLGRETITGSSYLRAGATLESQHILLRL
jgi:hypothetical protein